MTRMLIALAAAFAACGAGAQTRLETARVSAATPAPLETTPAASTAPGHACCHVPANTVVDLEILDLIGSHRHKRGDKFRIRVVTPVTAQGRTLIAAGTLGVGEIVHAAPARGGGAPGELLIAARSLDVAGHPVPLRGLKLGLAGGDNSGMALGVSFAAGPFAMFIRGHEVEIPAGTRVNARLAQDLAPAPIRIPSPPTASPIQE